MRISKKLHTPTQYVCKNPLCHKVFIDDKFEKRSYCSLKCKYTHAKIINQTEALIRFQQNKYDWYGASTVLKKFKLVIVPPGKIPHHKDNNSRHNKKENLFFCTIGQNRVIHTRAYEYIVKLGMVEEYLQWIQNHPKYKDRENAYK